MSRFYFIQLSDTHLFADPSAEIHGVNPCVSLKRVIARIQTMDPPPAFVILTGDLIGDDDPRSYDLLRELVSGLEIPIHYAVGNHDLRQPLRRTLLGEPDPPATPWFYEFRVEDTRCLVLDSQIPGQVEGRLEGDQLSWLEQTLNSDPDVQTLIFVHHPPTPIGVDWLDPHHIENGPALLRILGEQGNVQRLFFGHVHMPVVIDPGGLRCASVPSTCYQFGETDDAGHVVEEPPGLHRVEIDGDRIFTRIESF